MGSSWALVCSTAFVLVLLSSASTDEPNFEQREVTFDLDQIIQEMEQQDSMTLQKEVDFKDLVNSKGFLMQHGIEVPPHMERGRPSFGPRSFGGPPTLKYPVQFPLSRPTFDNIQVICLNGDHRPRYPDSYFPNSGFGQQRRMATAVNNAEAWFGSCCKRNQTWEADVMLCCATQAWELSLELFCEENSRVKDRQHHCCLRGGSEKLSCFNEAAENPSYEPTELLPVESLPPSVNFSFEPSTCQRKLMTPYSAKPLRRKIQKKPLSSQKIDINFPPGQPTADNIELLCSSQKLRPLYNTKCLPRKGYELLASQAKTINRLEKGFKQCCKKKHGVLTCADQKWREELSKFCLAASHKQEPEDLRCCLGDEANQYTCFQQTSPDPNYNMTSATEDPSLSKICDTHSVIRKRFPVGFPLTTFVSQCCPLPDQEKASCSVEKLEEISQNLCPPKKTYPPAVRRCCKTASREEMPQCISKVIMDAITKATNVLRKKKRKICPIS